MSDLTTLFGTKPRIRLMEAILELASIEFTRSELALEAGVSRSNAIRVVPDLEAIGLIKKIRRGRIPRFRVDTQSPYYRILVILEAGLHLTGRNILTEEDGLEGAEAFQEAMRFHLSTPDVV